MAAEQETLYGLRKHAVTDCRCFLLCFFSVKDMQICLLYWFFNRYFPLSMPGISMYNVVRAPEAALRPSKQVISRFTFFPSALLLAPAMRYRAQHVPRPEDLPKPWSVFPTTIIFVRSPFCATQFVTSVTVLSLCVCSLPPTKEVKNEKGKKLCTIGIVNRNEVDTGRSRLD